MGGGIFKVDTILCEKCGAPEKRRGPAPPFDKLRVVRSLEPQREPMGLYLQLA